MTFFCAFSITPYIIVGQEIKDLARSRRELMASEKVFTSAQVSLHNNINDCWVIINAKVYEVTNFLDDHPGGSEILLAEAGKDASGDFEAAGHGSSARLMLDEFYVGEFSSTTTPKVMNLDTSATQKTHRVEKEESKSKTSLFFLFPLAILGFVVSVGFFKK